MAACEHEAQQVIADLVVECGVDIRRGQSLLGRQVATEFLVLAIPALVSRR